MKQRQFVTNSQSVNELMDYVPLGQVFVMEALHKLAELVLRDEKKLMKEMKNHIIAPEAWIHAAKEWKRIYEKQRKSND
jgi:hypothetical protein